MTEEEVKDLRLMLDMISKDFRRLGEDMKALSDYLKPLQISLCSKEEKNVEYIIR